MRNCDDLLTFFGGSAGVVCNNVPSANSSNILRRCLKNTTLQTRQMGVTQTQTLPKTDFVRGDETNRGCVQEIDPNFGAEG